MTRPIYLITGPSGAGKTAVSNYLDSHGHTSVEADSTPGLCYYVNKVGKPVPYPPLADAAWWNNHNYVWELDRLKRLITTLQDGTGPVFLCGNAGNIAKAWDMFTAVYYLDIPTDTMIARLNSIEGEGTAGKRVDNPEQLLRWAEPFKKEMLELGAINIDASRSVEAVATDIINRSQPGTIA